MTTAEAITAAALIDAAEREIRDNPYQSEAVIHLGRRDWRGNYVYGINMNVLGNKQDGSFIYRLSWADGWGSDGFSLCCRASALGAIEAVHLASGFPAVCPEHEGRAVREPWRPS